MTGIDLDWLKGLGGYTTTVTLIIGGLLTWWKVLPSLIDAISNRQSNIEHRMGELLASATERFEKQLASADKRHDDCMAGQERLVARINEQDVKIAELSRTVEARDEVIAGLRKQFTQLQTTAIREEGKHPVLAPMAAAAIEALGSVHYEIKKKNG